MVEYPLSTGRDVAWGHCKERLSPIVSVILHPVLRPNHSVGVIAAIINPAAIGESKSSPNAARSGIPGSVNRGRRGRRRILRDPLHDVLLTTGWPAHGANVRAQHPECRPEASGWNELHSGFHSSELKIVSPRRAHASRGPCSARCLNGTENQVTLTIFKNIRGAGVTG